MVYPFFNWLNLLSSPQGYKAFFMLNSTFFHAQHNWAWNLNCYTKCWKWRLPAFKPSGVISIMLINAKMPTIVGILTFMSIINFMLRWVEHEKSLIISGPGLIKFILYFEGHTGLHFLIAFDEYFYIWRMFLTNKLKVWAVLKHHPLIWGNTLWLRKANIKGLDQICLHLSYLFRLYWQVTCVRKLFKNKTFPGNLLYRKTHTKFLSENSHSFQMHVLYSLQYGRNNRSFNVCEIPSISL